MGRRRVALPGGLPGGPAGGRLLGAGGGGRDRRRDGRLRVVATTTQVADLAPTSAATGSG
jgi:hypothetical protein